MNNFGLHNQFKTMATVITSTSNRTQQRLKKFQRLSLYLFIVLFISLSVNGFLIYTHQKVKKIKEQPEKNEKWENEKRKLENQISTLSSENKELSQSYSEAYKKVSELDAQMKTLTKENESLKAVKEKMQSMENVRKSYNQSLEITKGKK
jgi:cell division protein FtsB